MVMTAMTTSDQINEDQHHRSKGTAKCTSIFPAFRLLSSTPSPPGLHGDPELLKGQGKAQKEFTPPEREKPH